LLNLAAEMRGETGSKYSFTDLDLASWNAMIYAESRLKLLDKFGLMI
jgi:hypothetical protein